MEKSELWTWIGAPLLVAMLGASWLAWRAWSEPAAQHIGCLR